MILALGVAQSRYGTQADCWIQAEQKLVCLSHPLMSQGADWIAEPAALVAYSLGSVPVPVTGEDIKDDSGSGGSLGLL